MTLLDQLIANAFATEGTQDAVNKVYLALLQTLLYLPVQKNQPVSATDEPFVPLFAIHNGNYFLTAFDTLERLQEWAGAAMAEIDYVEISGKDLMTGISDQVFFCLNYGFSYYKEFSPEEVKRLKMIVSRIEQFKTT